jgi:PAS domain S-box-containing protein
MSSVKNKKIIIIESEIKVSNELKNSLHEIDYKFVQEYTNIQNVLKTIVENPVDLIILNTTIEKEQDGINFAHEVSAFFNIPIIFLINDLTDEIISEINKTSYFGIIQDPKKQKEIFCTIEIAFKNFEIISNLKNKEEQYKKFIENLNFGICLIKNDSILSLNSQFCDIVGEEADNLINQKINLAILKNFKNNSLYQQIISENLTNNIDNNFTVVERRRNDQVINLKGNIKQIELNNEIYKIITLNLDIDTKVSHNTEDVVIDNPHVLKIELKNQSNQSKDTSSNKILKEGNFKLISFFDTLNNEDRINIIKLLKEMPLSVNEFSKIMEKSNDVIYHHLRILEQQNLIRGQKKDKFTYFELDLSSFREIESEWNNFYQQFSDHVA